MVPIRTGRVRGCWSTSTVQGKLPAGVSAELGPDATGVGWIYEYALVDRSGKHDLADLRSLQDWFLKYELKPSLTLRKWRRWAAW